MEKKKVFKGGFTVKTIYAIIIPFGVAGLLIFFGYMYIPVFPGEPNRMFRIIFGYVPMVFGGITVIMALWAIIDSMLVKITVTPEYIECQKGAKKFRTNWHSLAFAAPHPEKKIRTFSIGDGNVLFWITDIFFPNFDVVVQLIKAAKEASSRKGFEI